jgi:hypothetical protein
MIVRGSDKYFRAPFLDENEIDKVVKDYAEYLFGSSILFLSKSKITTLGGAGTIPDGFVKANFRRFSQSLQLSRFP